MKIAFNGLFLTRPYTGMGQYTLHLLRALAAAKPRHRYVVIMPAPLEEAAGLDATGGTNDLTSLIALKNITVAVVPPRRRRLGAGLALDHWEAHELAAAVADAKVDLYHTPYPTPPPQLSVPVMMTVHDMIPWQLPEYRRGLKSGIKKSRQLSGIKAADHICTVSQASKDEIVRVAQVDPNVISVTYDGVDDSYTKTVPAATVRRVKKQFGLRRPYLLYFGGYDTRKNVRGLLEGFARSGLARSHDLVLAGSVSAPATKLYVDHAKLPDLVKRHRLGRSVRTTGWLSDADKRALLTGTAAFVYPSLAEGFGLPVLEALAVGAPVAASQIPPTVELFGDAVTVFDPEDPRALAAALAAVVGLNRRSARPALRASKKAGRELAARYTWEGVAAQTIKAYRQVVGLS